MGDEREVAKRKFPNEECDNCQLVKKEKLTDTKNEGISEQEVIKRKIPNEECEISQPVEKEKLSDTENDLTKESLPKRFDPSYRAYERECKVCYKEFHFRLASTKHMESPNHKRRVKYRANEKFCCKPCNRILKGLELMNIHVRSKAHQNHITTLKLEKKLKTKVFKNGQTYNYSCNACRKKFENIINYDQHMSGPSHSKTLLQIEVEEKAYCQACNKVFTSLSYYAEHLSTTRHLRNTQ